ncbi:MAG: rhomboid family intramembrane serine protease [Chloroflexi bacterium]|nr:rhomboid family intramembrane serine protease [Chloroflexota bacterium]
MIPIGDAPGSRRTFPWVMLLLLVINVLVYLVEASLPQAALRQLILSAGVVPTEYLTGREVGAPPPAGIIYLTLLTSMFLHGGLLHVGGNMLYLWVFGDNVEDALGHLPFFLFYLACGILAGLTHIALNPTSSTPSIGASGAIAGVLAGYLVLFPHASIRTLLILGPFITITRLSALVLIGFWFVLQFVSGLLSLLGPEEGGVAFWAHVGGFVAGLVLVNLLPKQRAGASSF